MTRVFAVIRVRLGIACVLATSSGFAPAWSKYLFYKRKGLIRKLTGDPDRASRITSGDNIPWKIKARIAIAFMVTIYNLQLPCKWKRTKDPPNWNDTTLFRSQKWHQVNSPLSVIRNGTKPFQALVELTPSQLSRQEKDRHRVDPSSSNVSRIKLLGTRRSRSV